MKTKADFDFTEALRELGMNATEFSHVFRVPYTSAQNWVNGDRAVSAATEALLNLLLILKRHGLLDAIIAKMEVKPKQPNWTVLRSIEERLKSRARAPEILEELKILRLENRNSMGKEMLELAADVANLERISKSVD